MTAWLIAGALLLLQCAQFVFFVRFRRKVEPPNLVTPSDSPAVPETVQQQQWPALQHALEQIAMLDIEIRRLKTATEERDESWESRMAAMSTRIQRAREPRPKPEPEESVDDKLKRIALEQLTIPMNATGGDEAPHPHPQWLGGAPIPVVQTTAERFRRRGA